MTTAVSSSMRIWVKWAAGHQIRVENRVLNALLTGAFVFYLTEPVIYLFFVKGSPIWRVARLSYVTWGIGACFVLCLLALLPYMWLLLTSGTWLDRRLQEHLGWRSIPLDAQWPRLWATRAAVGAAVIWMVLAALAVPMDYVGLQWAFAARAFGALCMGGVYGVSLNAQHLRDQLHEIQDE
jgi:hypothetical protein